MFRRWSNNWALTKASAQVLSADKELLIFPLMSALGLVLVSAALIRLRGGVARLEPTSPLGSQPGGLLRPAQLVLLEQLREVLELIGLGDEARERAREDPQHHLTEHHVGIA